MLIIKQDTPNSTAIARWQFIAGADYTKDTEVGYLMVQFRNGSLYTYFGLPTSVGLNMVVQTSAGAYLNHVVKPRYENNPSDVVKMTPEQWNEIATTTLDTEGNEIPFGSLTV